MTLPNKISAKKRVRQNARLNLRNRAAKSEMRTMIKKTVATAKEAAAVPTDMFRETQALIARMWTRGVIHKKKAARLQSRLARNTAKLAAK